MTTRQTTPPAAPAVSLAAAQLALRADVDANGVSPLDDEIMLIAAAATAEAEHATGRAFIERGYRVTLDAFPDAIRLEHAPIIAVQSVKFYDTDNVLQTLDPADYLVDPVSEPGWIVPAPGKAWPASAVRANAVMADYTAGYGPTDASVPDQAKLYILARVKEQLDPATGRREAQAAVSPFIAGLLDSLKVYG